jgi:hypothetical protein
VLLDQEVHLMLVVLAELLLLGPLVLVVEVEVDLFPIHLPVGLLIQHCKVDLVVVVVVELVHIMELLVVGQETIHQFLHHKEIVVVLAVLMAVMELEILTILMVAAVAGVLVDLVEMLLYQEDLLMFLEDLVVMDLQYLHLPHL